MLLRWFTVAIAAALGAAIGVSVGVYAVPRPTNPALVLDSHTPIVVRTEDASGTQVMPPVTMPLWRYVQEEAAMPSAEMDAFQFAFEADLHRKDPTFHRTHELIDGRTWGDD